MIERFISNIITGHYIYLHIHICSELHTSQELYYALSTHKLLFLRVFSRLKSRYQQRHVPLEENFAVVADQGRLCKGSFHTACSLQLGG